MYKLLIVEDEPIIRAGLKKYFDWDALGFTTIAEADNGKAGFDVALSSKPDLIITDIQMPEMNGLELIEKLQEHLPDCVFVILSGYEDFSYAKKAIELGVNTYLLKPLQFEESMATIRKCIGLIEERTQLKYLRDDMNLRTLIEQDWDETKWKRISQEDLIPGGDASYLAVLFELFPDQYPTTQENNEAIIQLRSDWHSFVSGRGQAKVISYYSNRKIISLLVYSSGSLQLKDVEQLVREFIGKRKNKLGGTVLCGIGREVDESLQIKACVRQAETALYERFLKEGTTVFISNDHEAAKGYPFSFTEMQKQALMKCIEQADKEQTRAFVKAFETSVREESANTTPEKWISFIQEIIGFVMRFIHKNDIYVREMYHTKLFTLDYLEGFRSQSEWFAWLEVFIYEVGMNYSSSAYHTEHRIFKQIESYILQNMERDITLPMVAEVFFYNPAYLSRLFKNKLNKNYLTFVSEIRVQCAKQLLSQNKMSIEEIGGKCGFGTYKQFAKTFKKVSGMTPSDYRKQLGGALG